MRRLIGTFRRVAVDAALLTAMTVAGLEALAGAVRLHHDPNNGNALVTALIGIITLCILLPIFDWHGRRQMRKAR